jgi:hypothetical protein
MGCLLPASVVPQPVGPPRQVTWIALLFFYSHSFPSTNHRASGDAQPITDTSSSVSWQAKSLPALLTSVQPINGGHVNLTLSYIGNHGRCIKALYAYITVIGSLPFYSHDIFRYLNYQRYAWNDTKLRHCYSIIPYMASLIIFLPYEGIEGFIDK